MWIERRAGIVRVWTPAKVNLFLEVLGRRPDGYHDLATLMVTVGLYDSLEIHETSGGEVRLTCDLPALSTGDDNLIVKAARLLRQRYGVTSGVEIRLRKRIPMASGLAGGSSDAAATLAGLDRLWRLNLGNDELGRLGAELGSDVTFFFHGPAAWCTGRGEVVEPLDLRKPLDLVLACPRGGLSTASVFRALTLPPTPTPGDGVRQALEGGEVERIGRALHNRLEEPAMKLSPEVAGLREEITRLGPAGVLMSGSGSTVFALARDAADARRLSRAMTSGQDVVGKVRVFVVRSCY
jgi:4-diphosphocytidyl-2-C-methyl-D-erythritol kinase